MLLRIRDAAAAKPEFGMRFDRVVILKDGVKRSGLVPADSFQKNLKVLKLRGFGSILSL